MENILLNKLTDRKIALEKDISSKENEMKEMSRQVSQTQVCLIELRSELRTIEKMIQELDKGTDKK